ncbi:MAG: circadian clock protein KaiB [Gemmatimonadetes bacterium]|nr:circadian clock protein KaiB [Gemmatimonadota bacterium]
MVTARRAEPRLHLRLYIAGNAPNSLLAVANAKSLCEEHFAERHVLEIVDLLEQPLRALADAIIVTPTLLKLAPLPAYRVIGNLNDRKQVLLTLSTNDE